jgi:hypothetical protein
VVTEGGSLDRRPFDDVTVVWDAVLIARLTSQPAPNPKSTTNRVATPMMRTREDIDCLLPYSH